MGTKPKTPQPKTKEVQGRDLFQTPNYAVDLLVPFIPQFYIPIHADSSIRSPKSINYIWECANGNGKIARRLEYFGYRVFTSDIREGSMVIWDFIQETETRIVKYKEIIITNPPFSLKYDFIYKAIEYDCPFAFLIPFDMCGKLVELFDKYDCQGIVPNRRIDYITPTGKSGATGHTAYYHSFWLTRYFNLKDKLVFVDLSLEEKKNNI